MKIKNRKFIFEVTVPDNIVDPKYWLGYIRDAVKSWKGQLHPEDPIFKVKAEKINVK